MNKSKKKKGDYYVEQGWLQISAYIYITIYHTHACIICYMYILRNVVPAMYILQC